MADKPTYEELEKRNKGLEQDVLKLKRTEDALQKKTHDLGERVKELNCLYGISKLVEQQDISLAEIFQGAVDLIPPSWQYPEITCARVIIQGREWKTKNFRETIWKQASDIKVHGEPSGNLEVYYLEEKPEIDEGPFLREERNLIDAIAGLTGRIVERKQAEEALRESEEKYRTLLETTPEGCWLLNPERKTIEVNESLCKMFGYSQDEMLGKTPFDFVDDENRKIFIEQTSKMSRTDHRSYEITLKKKNGQDLHTYFNATTIRDESGEVQGSFAFITDITERKRAEEEIRLLKEKYEDLYSNAPIMYLSNDTNGIIIECNNTVLDKLGYTKREIIGKHMTKFVTKESADSFKKDFPKLLKTGKILGVERQLVTKDREIIDVILDVTVEYDEHGKPIKTRATFEDITDRKQAEIALIERGKELENKTHELEEVNAALRVLLKHRDEDKKDLEEKVVANVKKLVFPYVEKLNNSRLNDRQMVYLNIIKSNLEDIITPFLHQLSSKYSDLTPSEIQVAGLVKEGKTTKEIAELLNSSTGTIDFHRNNLRKKLGLRNTKTNLRSFLLALT